MKRFFRFVIQFKLKFLASHILKKFHPKIIAITGSVAKSTTKEAIFYVLREKYHSKIARSIGNLNTEIGSPLAILGFKKNPRGTEWIIIMLKSLWRAFTLKNYPKILILEMAADKPGDIEYLTSFIKPKIAVITAIGPAHLEKFLSIKNVVNEKMNLVRALPQDGVAFLNKNDEILTNKTKTISQKVIWYEGGENLSQNVAILIGKFFKLSDNKINKGLQKIKPIRSRLNLILTKNGSTIIDDTYNANPASVKFAINHLVKIAPKRKIAILGDMLELGEKSKIYHRNIGQFAKNKVDVVIAVGDLAKNFPKANLHYSNTEEAIQKILSDFQFLKDDFILIKGSRRMKMENIVQFLQNKI